VCERQEGTARAMGTVFVRNVELEPAR
jgi:hypothetical protein